MAELYPWYDSLWLCSYVQAKKYIEHNYPQKSQEFLRVLDPLKTDPDFSAKKIKDVFDQYSIQRLRDMIQRLDQSDLSTHELKDFGRHVIHRHPLLNEMQDSVVDLVSELVGEPVEYSYNFLSLYQNLGVCQVHLDGPDAKWTLDLCIDQSTTWPIYLSQVRPWPEQQRFRDESWESDIVNDPQNTFSSYSLEPGDALIFSGSAQWHYRNRIPERALGNFCNLAFLHFIPKGMHEVVEPNSWAKVFNIPELDRVVESVKQFRKMETVPPAPN